MTDKPTAAAPAPTAAAAAAVPAPATGAVGSPAPAAAPAAAKAAPQSLAAKYSKFDHIGDDDDDAAAAPKRTVNVTKFDAPQRVTIPAAAAPAAAKPTAAAGSAASAKASDASSAAAMACANCAKTPAAGAAAYKRCSACHRVAYCSPDCQRAHWKAGHKEQCKALRTAAPAAAPAPASAAGAGSSAAAAAAAVGAALVTPETEAKLAASDPKAAAAVNAAAAASQKYVKRKPVTYDGRVIYEWEQELEDVHIYITPPPGVAAKQFHCTITETHVQLGIRGADRLYLDDDTGGPVTVKQSFWMFEDGVIHIQLTKAEAASVWACALKGRAGLTPTVQLNAMELQQVQQKLMLERFQAEHTGFDFSQATFSGAAPDPRKFLGGLDYQKIGR